MKIAVFGLTISSSWGNGHATPYRAILRSLNRAGHDISFFEKDVPYYAARRDFEECDFCELHLYSQWNEVRSFALQDAAESDAVICASYCPEGARIIDDVLELDGPTKVFYDLDTPVTLAHLTVGDIDYLRRDQIPCFDGYLSFTGGRILDRLSSEWGARNPRPLYGCVDPDVHAREVPRDEYRCTFSYMGTHAADRQPKLDRLFLEPARSRPYERFLLAGSLYPWEMSFPSNVYRIEHVVPAEHRSLYSSSRMTLNITRSEMADSGYCPSGRFFEASACGTPIITDWFEGLETFFHTRGDEAELIVVQNAEDVIAALNRTDDELAEIAARARRRTLDQHTGDRRAREMLRYLEQAAGKSPQASGQLLTMKGEMA